MNKPQNTMRGILFMLAAMLIFSAQDGISKHLARHYSTVFITMLRFWFFGLGVLVILSRVGFRKGLKSAQPKLQMFRGTLLSLQIIIAVYAFHVHGLLETHAIFAFGPLLVVAMSGPVLGEKVGWRRWAAVGVGLCGMLMILRLGTQVLSASMGIAIVAMIGFVIYGLSTRKVAKTDGAMTSFYYTGLFGAITMTFIGPFFWEVMTTTDSILMLILSATGMTGHLMLIKAFEAAEAAAIQPYAYLQTVFAGGIGVLWFGEALSPWTVAGSAVVISAGLFALWREQVAARGAMP